MGLAKISNAAIRRSELDGPALRYFNKQMLIHELIRGSLVYIDMNMVRAGVVRHPAKWAHGGYREIQQPPKRYRIIDIPALMEPGGFNDIATMQQQHRQ